MTTLTSDQTTDMLGDLAAGDLDDVFSQDELQRFYDRAESDYNLAVFYGWRQILANSAKWVNYRVAQTQVDRAAAFDHIKAMLDFWGNEARVADNQLASLGINGIPPNWKNKPGDALPRPQSRNRSHSNWRDW